MTTQSLARFVELSLSGVDIVFSDNYFDVPVGRTITIYSPLPDGWSLAQVQSALQVKSLYDSYT